MKKIGFILGLSLMIVSCGGSERSEVTKLSDGSKVYKIQIEGHDYYEVKGSLGDLKCIVHCPECKKCYDIFD